MWKTPAFTSVTDYKAKCTGSLMSFTNLADTSKGYVGEFVTASDYSLLIKPGDLVR
jgi:hypothetical protein